MTRREFPRAVKVAAIKDATRDGVVYCDGCGLPIKTWRVDHIRADGLLGEPTRENAQVLGPCCYVEKDAEDNRRIKQAQRREAAALGVSRQPARKIQSRGFEPPAPKDRTLKKDIPPRASGGIRFVNDE